MNASNKIAERFRRAHGQYRQAATVQAGMCDELVNLLNRYNDRKRFSQVLEIGCGAGSLTDKFLANYAADKLILNDLYADVLDNPLDASLQNQVNSVQSLIGDITTLPLPGSLDLVLSGAALQWIYPLDELLAKLYQAMAADGVLAFSSFGVDNLCQMRMLTGRGLDYYTLDGLAAVLQAAGFRVLYAGEAKSVLSFNDALSVLKHLKDTGVTGLSVRDAENPFIWTKGRLAKFSEDYQALAIDGKLPLTYHPLYIIAKK